MRVGQNNEFGFVYLGNFAACEPWAAKSMQCDKCMVNWVGCWDNFQCPRCGEGELPGYDVNEEANT
jgi:hypothetical protein